MRKYRFKTKQEFEETCQKNEEGNYICGEDDFIVEYMHPLFGVEYKEHPMIPKLVILNNETWFTTPEMLVEIKD